MSYDIIKIDDFIPKSANQKANLARFAEATHILIDYSQGRNRIRQKTIDNLNGYVLGIIGGTTNKFTIAAIYLYVSGGD